MEFSAILKQKILKARNVFVKGFCRKTLFTLIVNCIVGKDGMKRSHLKNISVILAGWARLMLVNWNRISGTRAFKS